MSCTMTISSNIGSHNGGGPTSRPCQLILQQCLALTIRKIGGNGQPLVNDSSDFWMYDSGYLLFQSFLTSNAKCWWNKGLVTACKQLRYVGYVQYGILLISSKDACALELVRAAFARGVLKPPEGHVIHALGDIEDCIVTPCIQGQFTPLPEALCDVILELTTAGIDAGLESMRKSLSERFPNIQMPSHETVYDTLAQLIAERKIYHTSKGYFIVTSERRRSRSHSSNGRCPSNSSRSTPTHHNGSGSYFQNQDESIIDEEVIETRRRMLLSEDELLVIAHGDMATLRDGHVTHQCVQTSLRDVICGGSPSDKIIYPRSAKRRSASFPVAPRNSSSPERRRSTSTGRGGPGGTALRIWGSARRLRRSASTRSLARDKHNNTTLNSTDSSSGTESNGSPKKASLLSRLFRRSTKRNQPLGTFSAQFPPPEWFNSTAIHLHSVGTQTSAADMQRAQQEYYNCANSESTGEVEIRSSARSATLPRSHITRSHRRNLSNESNGLTMSYVDSRDQSPNPRRLSPILMRNYNTNSLPRSPNHKARKSSKTSIDTSKTGSSKTSINDKTKDAKTLIDSRNRTMRQQIKGESSRHTPEYRSMRESTLERRQRYAIENRSMRSTPTKSRQDSPQTTSFDLNESINISVNDDSLESNGPSSLESQKTGYQTSGPSSLESQKTVVPSPKFLKNDTNFTKVKKSTNSSMNKSNSFTLQVTTNKNGVSVSNFTGETSDNSRENNTTTATATINGNNTKIFVQNSPVRSVITFENNESNEKSKNHVIINNDAKPSTTETSKSTDSPPTTIKNTNTLNKTNNDFEISTMNNRKLSLQIPGGKDSLNYKNVLKNIPPTSTYSNQFNSCSNPGSPIVAKSYDSFTGSYYEKNSGSTRLSLDQKLLDKSILNMQGSEPNLSLEKITTSTVVEDIYNFPSLSDLSFNFTSLAAQKILKGVSINSVDTLVELNMAANSGEKQNNCDLQHTDFGIV